MLLGFGLLLLLLIQSALRIRSYLHILQLESYQNARLWLWIREHKERTCGASVLFQLFGGILAAVLYPLGYSIAAYAVAYLAAVIGLCGARPHKEKKPLVFTWRVKRLCITLSVLVAVLLAVPAVLVVRGNYLPAVWVAVFALCIPFLVLLANFCNAPIEKAIALHFVRDAEKRLRAHDRLTVVGITGSYGKTSTKAFLHALLSVQYNVLMTPESFNTTMGVVRTIRECLLPTHEIFIAEMGAKGVGEIKEICDIVHPQYGILTSIGEQHLESFGSLQNVIDTKFELADAIPADGVVCLNTDNPYIAARPVTHTRVVTYGAAADSTADYRAVEISVGSDGSRFTVLAPDGERCAFTTKLLGAHNIQNLVGCIAMAHTLGVPLKKMVYPVQLLKPVSHRLELLPNGFIDDAYNSNPAGFRSALDTLAGFNGQRVLVTPGMVELGERQAPLNEELGAYAAACCDYAVLVGKRQAPPLKSGLLSAGFPESRIFVADNLEDGLAFVAALPAEGQRTVLLENDLPDNYN